MLGLAVSGCFSNSTPIPQAERSIYQLGITLLGERNELFLDSQGRLKSNLELSSVDRKITLSAEKGTILTDGNGNPLNNLIIDVDIGNLSPPKDTYIVSPIYNFQAEDATFKPGLLLSLSYEPETLPEEVEEKDLYIAYHDGSEWQTMRYKKFNADLHSVTTQLYDLNSTVFALLGPKKATYTIQSNPTEGAAFR